MKFRATIKDKTITFGNIAYARHHLGKFEGKDVIVDVQKIHNKRSLNQNAYYWACLDIIEDSTGQSRDDLHRLFKGMFLPRKEVTLGGKKYFLAGSTSDLTKGQFVDYLLKISAKVADLGIVLPSPDEYKKGFDIAFLRTDD